MAFIRRFDSSKINAMTKTELWKDCLLPDILNGEVFPAIRDNVLYFYHSGGCMFRYSGNGFKFNPKYLKSEFQTPKVKKEWEKFEVPTELLEKDIMLLKNISEKIKGFNFCEQYHNIKLVVAERFKGSEGTALERKYLGTLYPATFGEPNPTTFGEPKIFDKNNSAVKVIDIEVRANFETDTEKAEYAKCDLMLLNTETHELQFVEAKLCKDPRVSSNGDKPGVIEQVKKYNSWLLKPEDRENIVENYQNYIKIMNQLFDKNYEMPKTIKESAKLVIFEETDEHRKNHLPKLLEPDAIGAENIVIFEKDEVVLKEDKVVFKKGVKFALERIWQENCSK